MIESKRGGRGAGAWRTGLRAQKVTLLLVEERLHEQELRLARVVVAARVQNLGVAIGGATRHARQMARKTRHANLVAAAPIISVF